MATTPSTVELPRHADPHPTISATARAKHWLRRHQALLLVVAWVLSLLVAFELGHWVAEGMPPPREHAAEFIEHMAGLLGKYIWRFW